MTMTDAAELWHMIRTAGIALAAAQLEAGDRASGDRPKIPADDYVTRAAAIFDATEKYEADRLAAADKEDEGIDLPF